MELKRKINKGNAVVDIMDIAAEVLDNVGTPISDQAFEVDVSNPICPCCGAKLILNDKIPAGEVNQLSTEQITEKYATAEEVIPLVKETAEDIIDTFFEQEDADPEELINVTDKTIKNVIRRKSIELCSILANNYDLNITTEVIETHIKRWLKFLVKQFR